MRVTYELHTKGSAAFSIGALSAHVTLEGTVEDIKQLTEYLEQKYDLV